MAGKEPEKPTLSFDWGASPCSNAKKVPPLQRRDLLSKLYINLYRTLDKISGISDDIPFRKRDLFSADELVILMALSRDKDDIPICRMFDSVFDGVFPVGDRDIGSSRHVLFNIVNNIRRRLSIWVVACQDGKIRIFRGGKSKLPPAELCSPSNRTEKADKP